MTTIIKGKTLYGKCIDLPFVPELTLVEWQKQIVELVPSCYIDDSATFTNRIIQNGVLINTTNNRHTKLKDCIDSSKPVYFVMYNINPPQMALIRGNCRGDNITIDIDNCAICLLPMKYSLEFTETIESLPCCHTFHMECIGKMLTAFCPLCKTPIQGFELIKQLSRSITKKKFENKFEILMKQLEQQTDPESNLKIIDEIENLHKELKSLC